MGSKPKKIVILHLAHWDQLLGGAELQLKYLSQYIANMGHEVHFVYPNRTHKKIEDTHVRLHPLNYIKTIGSYGKMWFVYKRSINSKLSKIQPDIIITRTFSSWAGIASQYAKSHSLRHIHFIASNNDVNNREKKITWRKAFNKLELKYFNKIFNSNTEIVVQNEEQKRSVENKQKLKSILLSQAAPENDVALIDKADDELKVVWIANFKPLKRPEKFLEIVEHFKNRDDITFSMIGGYSNTYYNDLLKPYHEVSNFQYLGKLTNEEVNKVLDTAHVLVNTSDYEGFSNTFIQAWLRQVVVLSLNSDPNNILKNEKIGYQTNSIEKLKAILEGFCRNDKSTLIHTGNSAREYALSNHVINDKYFKKIKL
ncbi:glycosyltransferase family 4 protein [Mangrovimonas cancribranchiae]|uniref:Glycosyltransferase family 4 protein n=1 Tax=Mangrovimonas cancribranchiae TaxID=3080055 RepID=A0AAU6P7L3_9FLAO